MTKVARILNDKHQIKLSKGVLSSGEFIWASSVWGIYYNTNTKNISEELIEPKQETIVYTEEKFDNSIPQDISMMDPFFDHDELNMSFDEVNKVISSHFQNKKKDIKSDHKILINPMIDRIDKQEEKNMDTDTLLYRYIDKMDRDQSDLRRSLEESEKRVNERSNAVEERMDNRLNRIEDMITKQNDKIDQKIDSLSSKMDSTTKFINSLSVTVIASIAAMVIAVIISLIAFMLKVLPIIQDFINN